MKASECLLTALFRCKMKTCIICNYNFCHIKDFYFLLYLRMVDKRYWTCSHTINSLKLWVFIVPGLPELQRTPRAHLLIQLGTLCGRALSLKASSPCLELRRFQQWPRVEHQDAVNFLNGDFLSHGRHQVAGVGPLRQTREVLYHKMCMCCIFKQIQLRNCKRTE